MKGSSRRTELQLLWYVHEGPSIGTKKSEPNLFGKLSCTKVPFFLARTSSLRAIAKLADSQLADKLKTSHLVMRVLSGWHLAKVHILATAILPSSLAIATYKLYCTASHLSLYLPIAG